VWVSADEKMSYCTSCLPENGYKTKYYPNISAELASYYDSHNIPYEKIPPHNPACERMQTGTPPFISSLTDGLDYYIQQNESKQLMLACNVGSDVKEVYWYVNNKFLTKAKSTQKIFFTPEAGNVKISCTDNFGRNTDIYIKVHYL
jgi:penicillin-binding protein 1C